MPGESPTSVLVVFSTSSTTSCEDTKSSASGVEEMEMMSWEDVVRSMVCVAIVLLLRKVEKIKNSE